jgi:hypothetical protein
LSRPKSPSKRKRSAPATHSPEKTRSKGNTTRARRSRQVNNVCITVVSGNTRGAPAAPAGMKSGITTRANSAASPTPTAPNSPSCRCPATGETSITRKAAIVVSAPKVSVGVSWATARASCSRFAGGASSVW